jgi:hypothetical protein
VCRNIVADAGAVLGSFIHITCSTATETRYRVIVIDLVDGCDTGTTTNRARNGADNGSNRAAGQRANGCSAQSAGNSAFCGVAFGVVVNSMLHIVICHVNHVSS